MFHYRETRSGDFFLSRPDEPLPAGCADPAFMRFASKRGAAASLWGGQRTNEAAMLDGAALDWPVLAREVLTPARDGTLAPVRGYRSLVRPDTDEVMSVVTTTYKPAENAEVMSAALGLARQHDRDASLVAAVSFGKERERTLFAVRVCTSPQQALVVLAHNSHGGEGAVRFQLVQVDHETGSVLTPESRHATATVAHVGDVEERLRRLGQSSPLPRDDSETGVQVSDYAREVERAWEALADSLWTPRHTRALIAELWAPAPARTAGPPSQYALSRAASDARLTSMLNGVLDAATAFRTVCAYVDNVSEACERGDFTKDRDERLAAGAGTRFKQKAWRWMIQANT